MSSQNSKCRLVAVNGPIQLLSAVVALQVHLETTDAVPNCRAVLGINLLRTATNQRDEALLSMIRLCAPLLHDWDAVIDLRQTDLIPGRALMLPDGSEAEVIEIFFNLVEMPENQRLFQQWPQADKICYGDGLGVHTALADFMSDPTWRDHARRLLGLFIPRLRPPPVPRKIPGDRGYFLLDDHQATSHFRHVRMIEPARYRRLFERLAASLECEALDTCLNLLPSGAECDVLLLTNLAAPPVTKLHEEVSAYLHLLDEPDRVRPPVIVIKPHPRGRTDMLEHLRQSLELLYTHVIILAQDLAAALPVEIILWRAFRTARLSPSHCRVFATSTAAYSMPVLLGLPVKVGFGKTVCQKLYAKRSWLTPRLRHERHLRENTRQLTALCMEQDHA